MSSLTWSFEAEWCLIGAMTLGLAAISLLFVSGGIAHFVVPQVYLKMMPPYLPAHRLLVFLSGIAEVGLGIGLWVPELQSYSAWGLIALLVAVFPANIYMFQAGEKVFGAPNWALLLRLPLQGLLIFWAYQYTCQ